MSGLAGRIGELEEAEKRLEVLEERLFAEIDAIEGELTEFWSTACNYSFELDDFLAERNLPAIEEFVGLYGALAARLDVSQMAEWAALVRVRDGVDGTLPEDFPDVPVRGVEEGMPASPSREMDWEDQEEAHIDRLRHCHRYIGRADDLIEDFTEAARKAAEAGNAAVASRELAKAQRVCAQIPVAYQEWWHALGQSSSFGTAVLG